MNFETIAISNMSSVASHFVRVSLGFQIDIAKKVKDGLRKDKIYVFDTSKTFDNAQDKVWSGFRYKQTVDGKVGVLSVAAQATFETANTYRQYTSFEYNSDDVGVFL